MMESTSIFNRAVLGVLKSLDSRWKAFDSDDLTAPQEQAFRALVRAGLAEYRLEIQASVESSEIHRYVFRLSGVFDTELFLKVQSFHPDWRPESIVLELSPAFESRLTTQGMAEAERLAEAGDDGGFCRLLRSQQRTAAVSVVCESQLRPNVDWIGASLLAVGEPPNGGTIPQEMARQVEGLTGEEKALATLVAHPDWSDTKIAKHVGCSRTTLYDWERYRAARESLKVGKKRFRRADEA